MRQHNIKELLQRGLCVTVNSDDPAYFGGYMNANFIAIADALGLTDAQLAQFSLNAIEASFIDDDAKAALAAKVTQYLAAYQS